MARLGGAARRVFGPGRRGAWRRSVARRALSAVLAGTAVIGTVAVARTPPAGAPLPVAVAARDLPAGHPLAPGDVQEVSRPAALVPRHAAGRAADVVGRVLAGPVSAGEAMTDARLVGPGLLRGQPAGQVAAHVMAGDPGAVAMVRAGDRVDVLSTRGERLAESVVVLAVDAAAGGGSAWGGVGQDQPRGVVLSVAPDVASRLARQTPDELLGSSLTLVLRNVT